MKSPLSIAQRRLLTRLTEGWKLYRDLSPMCGTWIESGEIMQTLDWRVFRFVRDGGLIERIRLTDRGVLYVISPAGRAALADVLAVDLRKTKGATK